MWVAYDANISILLRTRDAVGARLAAPSTPHHRRTLAVGDAGSLVLERLAGLA
ncbi:hypothetical protein [Cellulosimicrobium sp. 22601]|uniref:hypothetical protein n=1 Tax=unclassified Cellulosimicrobium TaxID=2624466 RepID=UPI003F85EDD2